MKKRFKLLSVLLTAAVFLSLVACSARTPATTDDFTKQAKAQGFAVKEDSTTNTAIVKYLEASKAETQTQVLFVTFKTESDAQSAYASVKKTAAEGTNVKTTTLDSSSYNKFTAVNGEISYTIIRMNDTLLYGKANSGHQNQVDDLVKAVKY